MTTNKQIRGTVRGKALYAQPHIARPTFRSKTDSNFAGETEFKVTVEIDDPKELKRVKELLKELKVKTKIKTENAEGDSITPQITFKRLGMTSKGISIRPPIVVDASLRPTQEAIGNGSDIEVQFKARPYTDPSNKVERHSLDLEAVQIKTLIPYSIEAPLLFEASESDKEVDEAFKANDNSVF